MFITPITTRPAYVPRKPRLIEPVDAAPPTFKHPDLTSNEDKERKFHEELMKNHWRRKHGLN